MISLFEWREHDEKKNYFEWFLIRIIRRIRKVIAYLNSHVVYYYNIVMRNAEYVDKSVPYRMVRSLDVYKFYVWIRRHRLQQSKEFILNESHIFGWKRERSVVFSAHFRCYCWYFRIVSIISIVCIQIIMHTENLSLHFLILFIPLNMKFSKKKKWNFLPHLIIISLNRTTATFKRVFNFSS